MENKAINLSSYLETNAPIVSLQIKDCYSVTLAGQPLKKTAVHIRKLRL